MKIRFWLPALAVLIVACGPSLASRVRSVNGVPVAPVGGLSCSSLPVVLPDPPTQAMIDATKPFLSEVKWKQLNLMFEFFPEILLDGVHDGST